MRTHTRLLGALFASTLLVLAFGSSVALAQTSTQTAPSAGSAQATAAAGPAVQGIYQVQLAPATTAGQAAVIVAVQLPPNTKLPATILIPIPQSGTPTWVGEILGGDPTQDPQRTYTTVQGTGGQALQVTLEQTRSAQAEFTIPSTTSGANVTANLTWIQSEPSDRTEFSVRMPSGVSQVQITPKAEGTPVTNELGEALYGLPTKVMKPGETTVVSVSYVTSQGGQQGQQPGTASGGSTVLYVLLGALLFVLAVLGFSLMSKRSQGQ